MRDPFPYEHGGEWDKSRVRMVPCIVGMGLLQSDVRK